MSSATPEPQPCGPIASATHCCEYHGIHSDDDVLARIAHLEALLDTARDAAVQATARGAQIERDRDEQLRMASEAVTALGGQCNDQRVKLDGARQLFERLRHAAVPVELSHRIDQWLASAMPSDYERVCNHLIRQLVIAAVGWSSGDGTLEDLQQAAHQLRAAGEL